jgi:hypothetical protein
MIDEEWFAGVAREQNLPLGNLMLIFGMAGAKKPLIRDILQRKFLIKKVLPPLGV